jgi:transcriptional regulator with XRE-family HTH domain
MTGERLRSERLRLGLTQPEFAELAGAKKRTLVDWESDVSSPTAKQLAALAAHGVDVLFVLTGSRSVVTLGMTDADRAAFNQLVDDFDACSDEGRATVLGVAGAMRQQAVAAGTSRRIRRRAEASEPPPAATHHSGAVQTFHAPVNQVAGRDVINKGGKRK